MSETVTKFSEKQFIEKNQELIVSILIKSFYYSKNNYDRQQEYWGNVKKEIGIDILQFTPSQLMSNKHIREKLTEAFLDKHKGFHMKWNTPQKTLEHELAMAMLRSESNPESE